MPNNTIETVENQQSDEIVGINFNLYQNIPEELRVLPQWVLWKKEPPKNDPNGKLTKVPYSLTGHEAKTTDSRMWKTLPQTLTYLQNTNKPYDGIGFVFTESDEYMGLDIDHCFDSNGKPFEDVQLIINMVNTYTELSQSKTGLHAIIRGHKCGSRCQSKKELREGQVEGEEFRWELYEKLRFFVFTGDVYGEAKPITGDQDTIDTISKFIFPIEDTNDNGEPGPVEIFELGDEKIIGMGLHEKNQLFKKLFIDGDVSLYGNDDSQADAILCMKIAFYTVNPEQIERIFNQSKLGERSKWKNTEGYRNRTIKFALSVVKEHYEPNQRDKVAFQDNADPKLKKTQEILWKETSNKITLNGRNGGLYESKYNAREKTFETNHLTNFVCWAEKTIVTSVGKRKYVIAGYADLKPLPVITVDVDHYNTLEWAREKWGARIWICSGKGNLDGIRAIFDFLSLHAPEITEKTNTGFEIIDGQRVYLTSGGVITEDGLETIVGVVTKYEPEIDRYSLSNEIYDAKSIKDSVQTVIKLLDIAPKSVTYPMLANTYLAPLTAPFKDAGYEPTYLMWLFGRTGDKKTSLTSVFLSHFGKFTSSNPPASFLDTSYSIEKKSNQAKDILMLYDDYSPQENPAEAVKIKQMAEKLIRGYGDRVGRSRLNKDLELKESFKPRGIGIVTGESMPEGGESSVARVFGVELPFRSIDLSQLTTAQGETGKLRIAMTAYIRYVMKNYDRLKDEFETTFAAKRQGLGEIEGHPRVMNTVVWLLFAFTFFLEFAYGVGAITAEETKAMAIEGNQEIINGAKKQNTYVADEKPEVKFMNAANALITSGKVSIFSTTMVSTALNRDNMVGWFDNDHVYLIPELIYTEVEKFLSGKHSSLGVPPKTLWRNLAQRDIITPVITTKAGIEMLNYTPRVIINGHKRTVLTIKGKYIEKMALDIDS